jgi:ketosteroid isomerase-like protein
MECGGLGEIVGAMSENVEAVREAYGRINAGPQEPGDPAFFHPDFEFDARDVAPDMGIVPGLEAVDEAMHEYRAMFDGFHIELIEVLHADGEVVVTAVKDGGRMKGSDAEVWNRLFHVLTFREGKIARMSAHTDKNRALEAAGLAE